MFDHICAVVVTFNRKQLLLRCLDAILNQSIKPGHLIVVDNASNDGTEQALASHGFLHRKGFTYYRLEENLGGAGGFHYGVKLADKRGYSFCWLMDDDGFPSQQCLEKLLTYKESYDFYGPLVLDEENHNKLCFPMRLPGKLRILRSVKDVYDYAVNGALKDVATPFNGIVLNLAMVHSVGLPKKEFFIWGDDIEYLQRILRAKGRVATVCDAVFHHPTDQNLGESMVFGLLHFNDTDSALKLYCLCRNNVANLLEYKGKISALIFIAKCFWFYLFTKPSIKKLVLSFKAICHGLSGNFSYHKVILNGCRTL